jgi:broad specificity phosphatase PhoE
VGLIHLIRHERPAITGLLLGSTDLPLAEDVRIAPSLLRVSAVFCSPLRRARDTASCMFPGQPTTLCPQLAERDLGAWDGLTWAEVEQRWPEQARTASLDWFASTPPGAERWVDFEGRLARAFATIRLVDGAAVVAHAGVNAVLWELAGQGRAMQFQQQYGEIVSIEFS